MGQYWRIVNLTKREYLDPYKLDSGAKLCEQLASDGPGKALIVLLAAEPVMRGGGDLDLETKMYATIAKRTIGRWAGDQIAIVGDYAKDSDLDQNHHASEIYERCCDGGYLDVTDDVLAVLGHEMHWH